MSPAMSAPTFDAKTAAMPIRPDQLSSSSTGAALRTSSLILLAQLITYGACCLDDSEDEHAHSEDREHAHGPSLASRVRARARQSPHTASDVRAEARHDDDNPTDRANPDLL